MGACLRQTAVRLPQENRRAKAAASTAGTAKFVGLVGIGERSRKRRRYSRDVVGHGAASVEVERESDTAAIVPRALVVFFGLVCAIVGLGMVCLPVVALSQGAGPSLIVWLVVGFVFMSVAYVTLTRMVVAARFRDGEIGLSFGLGQRLTIRRPQLNRVRNLALARGSGGVAGDLTKQISPVYVLLTYTSHLARRDFAILVLPGVGPLGGRAREFRTPLDPYVERTFT